MNLRDLWSVLICSMLLCGCVQRHPHADSSQPTDGGPVVGAFSDRHDVMLHNYRPLQFHSMVFNFCTSTNGINVARSGTVGIFGQFPQSTQVITVSIRADVVQDQKKVASVSGVTRAVLDHTFEQELPVQTRGLHEGTASVIWFIKVGDEEITVPTTYEVGSWYPK